MHMKKMQEFEVEAASSEVYCFLLRYPKHMPITGTEGQPAVVENEFGCMSCTLMGTTVPEVRYRVEIRNAHVGLGRCNDCLANGKWVVFVPLIGWIDLIQTKPNHCHVELWVNTDVESWGRGAPEWVYDLGSRLIALYWRDQMDKLSHSLSAAKLASHPETPRKVDQTIVTTDELVLHAKFAEARVGNLEIKTPKRRNRTETGIRDNTRLCLQKLIKARNEHIRTAGFAPIWTNTCHEVGIDTKTVIKYVPELYQQWMDVSYLPDPDTIRNL